MLAPSRPTDRPADRPRPRSERGGEATTLRRVANFLHDDDDAVRSLSHSLTHSLAVAIRSEQRLGRPSASIQPGREGPREGGSREGTIRGAAGHLNWPKTTTSNALMLVAWLALTGRPLRTSFRPSIRQDRQVLSTSFVHVTFDQRLSRNLGRTHRRKRRPSVRVRRPSPCGGK